MVTTVAALLQRSFKAAPAVSLIPPIESARQLFSKPSIWISPCALTLFFTHEGGGLEYGVQAVCEAKGPSLPSCRVLEQPVLQAAQCKVRGVKAAAV
jgi:hypothetical protein